jgi:hypothetical protein
MIIVLIEGGMKIFKLFSIIRDLKRIKIEGLKENKDRGA